MMITATILLRHCPDGNLLLCFELGKKMIECQHNPCRMCIVEVLPVAPLLKDIEIAEGELNIFQYFTGRTSGNPVLVKYVRIVPYSFSKLDVDFVGYKERYRFSTG